MLVGYLGTRSGPAVFHCLDQLCLGDQIVVTRRGTTSHFPVQALLRLVTCGGSFTRPPAANATT